MCDIVVVQSINSINLIGNIAFLGVLSTVIGRLIEKKNGVRLLCDSNSNYARVGAIHGLLISTYKQHNYDYAVSFMEGHSHVSLNGCLKAPHLSNSLLNCSGDRESRLDQVIRWKQNRPGLLYSSCESLNMPMFLMEYRCDTIACMRESIMLDSSLKTL